MPAGFTAGHRWKWLRVIDVPLRFAFSLLIILAMATVAIATSSVLVALCAALLNTTQCEQCEYPALVSGSILSYVALVALLIFVIELSVMLLGVQGAMLAFAAFRKSTTELRSLLGASVSNLFLVRSAAIFLPFSVVVGAIVASVTGNGFVGTFTEVSTQQVQHTGQPLTWREQVFAFLAAWGSWSFFVASACVLWLPIATLVLRGSLAAILFPFVSTIALVVEYVRICCRNKRCVRRREVFPTAYRVLKRFEPNSWPFLLHGMLDYVWERAALVCCCYGCSRSANAKGCCPIRAPRLVTAVVDPCILPHPAIADKWMTVIDVSQYPRDDAENPPRVLAHREGTEQRAEDLLRPDPPPSLVLLKNRMASYSFHYAIIFGIALLGAPEASGGAAVVSFVVGTVGIAKALLTWWVSCGSGGRYHAMREASVAMHVPVTGDDGIIPDDDVAAAQKEEEHISGSSSASEGGVVVSLSTAHSGGSIEALTPRPGSTVSAGSLPDYGSRLTLATGNVEDVVASPAPLPSECTPAPSPPSTPNGSSKTVKSKPAARPTMAAIAAARNEDRERRIRIAAQQEARRRMLEKSRAGAGHMKRSFTVAAWFGGLAMLFTFVVFLVMLVGPATPLGAFFLFLFALFFGNSLLPSPAGSGCCSTLAKLSFALLCGAALFLSSTFSAGAGYKVDPLVALNGTTGLATMVAPVVATPLPTSYPLCRQTVNGLSVVDHAFLSAAIYRNDTGFLREVNAWFAPANITLEPLLLVGPDSNNTFADTGLRFAVLKEAGSNRLHAVIRGSVSNADWLMDFQLWSEALFLGLASYITPIQAWPLGLQKGVANGVDKLVTALNPRRIKTTASTRLDSNNIANAGSPSMQYLSYLQTTLKPFLQGNNVSMSVSGHSLGGGLSSFIGQMLAIPSVSFSGPGSVISGGAFLTGPALPNLPFTVIPDLDPVPRVDRQIGAIANVRCLVADPGACHQIERSTCELLHSCGDPYGRTLASCSEGYDYNISQQGLGPD